MYNCFGFFFLVISSVIFINVTSPNNFLIDIMEEWNKSSGGLRSEESIPKSPIHGTSTAHSTTVQYKLRLLGLARRRWT